MAPRWGDGVLTHHFIAPIGQDAEDAATADAERAAENTPRTSGPARAGRSERR